MAAEDEAERPEWIQELLAEISKPHENQWRQVREWIGLILGGAIVWLIASGFTSLEAIQAKVESTARVQSETKVNLDRHIESANAANLALSRILSRIEARTSRLEGIEEGRTHGRFD